MLRGNVAGHVREVESVEAGGQTLGLEERVGLEVKTGRFGQSGSMLLPALAIHRRREKDVVFRDTVPAHHPHTQATVGAGRGTRQTQSIGVSCQRLRNDGVGAQFQHSDKASVDLSIVLRRGNREEDEEEKIKNYKQKTAQRSTAFTNKLLAVDILQNVWIYGRKTVAFPFTPECAPVVNNL